MEHHQHRIQQGRGGEMCVCLPNYRKQTVNRRDEARKIDTHTVIPTHIHTHIAHLQRSNEIIKRNQTLQQECQTDFGLDKKPTTKRLSDRRKPLFLRSNETKDRVISEKRMEKNSSCVFPFRVLFVCSVISFEFLLSGFERKNDGSFLEATQIESIFCHSLVRILRGRGRFSHSTVAPSIIR